MPRFVILWHEFPDEHSRPSHWDLMLQEGTTLRTWALEQSPEIGCRTIAAALPDHRLAYLDYEGPISGHRGQVRAWDRGQFQWCQQDNEQIVVELKGGKLLARVCLTRMPNSQRWSIEFSAPDAAN